MSTSSSCTDGGTSSISSTRSKALETPYNTNFDVPTFYGLLFQVDVYSNITITSLDLDVRFPTDTSSLVDDGSYASTTNTNPVMPNRPKVEVFYRMGPYSSEQSRTAWYNNRTGWTQVFRGKAVKDSNRTIGVVLPPANFTSISLSANDVISFYVTMKGPYLDSTVNAMVKVGEALMVGNDLRVNVGSGLTDANFPQMINTTIDPGFAGVIHYELQSPPGTNNTAQSSPPCGPSASTPNMTITQLVFPMVWSRNDTALGIDHVNRIMEGTMLRFLKDQQHLDSTFALSSIVQQVGNATTTQDSGWLYTNLCPEGFDTCPPPAASSTTFDFEHDANAYSPAQLLYDLYHAHEDMVTALNAALTDDGTTTTTQSLGPAAQVAYAGPMPTELHFDLTLTLESSATGNNNGDDNASDDSMNNAITDRSLDVGQLQSLDHWMEQYLDQAVKSLTANHFIVHNLTNRDVNANGPALRRRERRRHVRGLQTTNSNGPELQEVLLSGTLLGLYESDRVGSAQQYATIVAGAFEKTAESEFLAFLDSAVATGTGIDSNASSLGVFQHLQSVTFEPTVVVDTNATTGNSATTDPTVTESTFTSNTLLLVIIGVVAGCLAVVAAILTYCCFCKGPSKSQKAKRREGPSEERAPDRPAPSRRFNESDRTNSRLSDSPQSNRGDVRRSDSDRLGLEACGNVSPTPRPVPQRSRSIPLTPSSTSPGRESSDPRLTRSAVSERSLPHPPSPRPAPGPRRDEPPIRGVRRSASSPLATCTASRAAPSSSPRTPPSGRPSTVAVTGGGARPRAQSFDGTTQGGGTSPRSGSQEGRNIRRAHSCDDLPTIREGANEAPTPRRKTRPNKESSPGSGGSVRGVMTQPSPTGRRRPLTKSKSMDCV